jgi:hypothetical protein
MRFSVARTISFASTLLTITLAGSGPVRAETLQQQTVQQALTTSRQYLQLLQSDSLPQLKELNATLKQKLYEASKASLDKSLPDDCKVRISRLQFLAVMDPTIGNPGITQKNPRMIKYFADSLDTADQDCNNTSAGISR